MQLPSQEQATHTRGAPLQAALPNSPLPPMFWCPTKDVWCFSKGS